MAENKASSSFMTGLKGELLGKATRDGVSAFNVENLIGTLIHAAAGVLVGRVVAKRVEPPFHYGTMLPFGGAK